MKNVNTILPITALILFSILFLSSCEKDPVPEPVPPPLLPLLLECPGPADGETVTLEDRTIGVDYIIDCLYKVNGKLIVDPNVTIQFGTDAGIIVESTGSLQALGTAEEKVVFTGEDKTAGSWRGIIFFSNDSKNRIEHTKIEYAGGNSFNSNGDKGAVIMWATTRLDMNNTTISNSETYGFNASYGDAELRLVNNTITGCNAPMYIEGEYPTTISGGSYTGNVIDAIIVDSDEITGNHTWTKLDVPYHLPSGLQVIPGGNLTIEPGVIMKFGQNSRLFINEGASGPKPSLVAVGSTDDPIVFTSIDNTLSAWRGIYFDSPNTLNEIGFATIENATNASQNGAIETWYGTVLNVHDVLFKDIDDCAIYQYISSGAPNTLTTSNLSFINVRNATICQN